MAFTTFTELKSVVADYLARTDLTAQIPDFITLAELRLHWAFVYLKFGHEVEAAWN